MIYSDFRICEKNVKYIQEDNVQEINFYGFKYKQENCSNDCWGRIKKQFQEF